MRWILTALLFSTCSPALAKTLRVAVVDTGLKVKYKKVAKLCPRGHNSSYGEDPFVDTQEHGTNIAGIITNRAFGDYCLIIIKADSEKKKRNWFYKGLYLAIKSQPDIINISWGGHKFNAKEHRLILYALARGIKIVAAAGNNGDNLGVLCNYYPACSSGKIIVVGNTHMTSNYGAPVDAYRRGISVEGFGIVMTGSSQATAMYTAELINRMSSRRYWGPMRSN